MNTTTEAAPHRAPQLAGASRRPAFHHYYDRDALLAAARREARLARGEDRFVWKNRVLPIGLPAGIVLGTAAWLRGREEDDEIAPSLARFAIAFSTAVGASWLGAKLEWRYLVAGRGARAID